MNKVKSKQCLHCGGSEAMMKKCSKCESELQISSYYCSKICQKMDWSRHKYEFHSKEDSFYCNSSDGVKVGSVPAVYGNLLGTPGVNKALFLASSQVAATSCKASSAKHLQLHHIQIHTLVQAHPCVLAAHDHRSLDISFRPRKCVRDVFVGCL